MTIEQQLETLKKMRNDVCEDSEDDQALYYAIRAIENAERIAESAQNVQNNDLIFRKAAIDALVKAIREDPYYDSNEAINGLGVYDVRVILNDLPSVQPQKKGKWISHKLGNGEESIDKDVCSECGNRFSEIAETGCIWNFCPNCGADMRGEQE